MDEAEIKLKVAEALSRFFDDPKLVVRADTVASEIPGWDSLTHVELMVEIEEEFGIRFRTGETTQLSRLGDLIALIARHLPR